MGGELLPTRPRPTPQVMVAEGVIEQLGLVEPRGVGGREPGTPPTPTGPEVILGHPGGVAGVAILDQVHTPQVVMPMPERLQLLDIMQGVLRLDARRLHPTGVDDQET